MKRTLRRWPHPNSQRKNRSILISFYRWMVEEGKRPSNPAEQTSRPRTRPTTTERLTRDEVGRMLASVANERERRAIYLLVYTGLRNSEIRGLRGRHFEQAGFLILTPGITKGQKGRPIPISAELAPMVDDIRRKVGRDEYVLPAQRWRNPPANTAKSDRREFPSSSQALNQLVKRVARRAGIHRRVYPHLLRHAFADHMARHAGLRPTQHMMGHSDSRTTEIYLGTLTPEELSAAIQGFTFELVVERTFYPSTDVLANPVEAPTGIEPV